MPVITDEGLAGQVVEVARYSAKVLLLIDQASSVAAVNSRSRDFGVVSGSPANRILMRFVGAGADMRPGDKIVTSPISTIFPAELPIGTVLKATKAEHDLFYHIEIDPAVDFSRIEKVFVVF
jgi:rod shape-determining protein MreC